MSRRLRITLWITGGGVAVLALAALVAMHLLLDPGRFTRMLQGQAHGAGLELNLASPARPGLFPQPNLELSGITLNAQGANVPILLAARGRLVLPWHTLMGGPTTISQLHINSPRVDLDALEAWLAAMPAAPAPSAPTIPRIDAGITISHGSVVRGNAVLVDNLDLSTGSLVSGAPFPLHLAATTASDTPLALDLTTTPQLAQDRVSFAPIHLNLTQSGRVRLDLNGEAHWLGGDRASARLAGKLQDAEGGSYALALELGPGDATQPLLLALTLDGAKNHIDLHLPPRELAVWWNRAVNTTGATALTLPPATGRIALDTLELGPARIRGLVIETTPTAPAAAATAAAPAQP